MTARIGRCVDQVPAAVPVGLRLCYGDTPGHQHFREPESLGPQVTFVNHVAESSRRGLSFVAFTVPQYRHDDQFFRPIADLALGPETELYFGIVPYYSDKQDPGTTDTQVRLIDDALTARGTAFGKHWGISTECGLARVDGEDLLELLDLHREILEAYSA
jgi:hypothetical protein